MYDIKGLPFNNLSALLGNLLDYFDEHDLWKDTALIVGTDHGFLLGEHDWWAKNRMPLYEEISHIPLFFYHPKFMKLGGERRTSLTQTIDLMPTFLDLYDAPIPDEVQGYSLIPILKKDITHSGQTSTVMQQPLLWQRP